ncbi:transposase, partial [Thiorhodococcus minor]
VELSYKDYRDGDRRKVMTLSGQELLRRFLLHVLPKGFMRVRHFGFLANRCRARRLPEIRAAIAAPVATPSPDADAQAETGRPFDGYPCPSCRAGRLRVRVSLAPQRRDGG